MATTTSWSRPALAPPWRLAALAAVASAVVGVAVARQPELGVLAAGIVLVGILIVRAPALACGVALIGLAYSPESLGTTFGVLGHPELQKGLMYAVLIAMALIRGVDWRLALPIAAYAVQAALSKMYGHLLPGLTASQMASTFVTLTIGWAALAVRWDWERDARFLKVVACIAPVCVALGVVLQIAGLHSLWKEPSAFDATYRLRGASIAAQLALMSFAGCTVAYMCHRLMGWRPARWLVAVNALILALTLSRGATIALAAAAVIPTIRFVLGPLPGRRAVSVARFGLVIALAVAVAAVVVPRLEARNAGGRYYAGAGTFQDPTSGRTNAWKEFYAIAQESPLFGHGLGSGPITKIPEKGFLAQHNEYLRMFLEGGYIGGGLLLLTMIVAIGTCIARAPPFIRAELTGIAVAWAGLSYFDNTLTSNPLTVPLCLMFALAAARGRLERAWR